MAHNEEVNILYIVKTLLLVALKFDNKKPQIVQIHSWLPNQDLHFKHVRCIECHTEVIDSFKNS